MSDVQAFRSDTEAVEFLRKFLVERDSFGFGSPDEASFKFTAAIAAYKQLPEDDAVRVEIDEALYSDDVDDEEVTFSVFVGDKISYIVERGHDHGTWGTLEELNGQVPADWLSKEEPLSSDEIDRTGAIWKAHLASDEYEPDDDYSCYADQAGFYSQDAERQAPSGLYLWGAEKIQARLRESSQSRDKLK